MTHHVQNVHSLFCLCDKRLNSSNFISPLLLIQCLFTNGQMLAQYFTPHSQHLFVEIGDQWTLSACKVMSNRRSVACETNLYNFFCDEKGLPRGARLVRKLPIGGLATPSILPLDLPPANRLNLILKLNQAFNGSQFATFPFP